MINEFFSWISLTTMEFRFKEIIIFLSTLDVLIVYYYFDHENVNLLYLLMII